MRKLSDTLTRLAAIRARPLADAAGRGPARLSEFGAFGSNPGALRAKSYIPAQLGADPPLVVVLHGCTQTAEAYDQGSGWSELADLHGFALLFPEQQSSNNANLCFNWFEPGDTHRGAGEALSIRQMVAAMVERHGIDPARIFVTGLSAGGAMTSVMLATYPDLFAGGAIIAGLPYGCASTVPEAFDRMRGHGLPSAKQLEALVRKASDHDGPWPTISIWHGTADFTVSASNVDAIVEQWRGLHGVEGVRPQEEVIAGYPRRAWRNAAGREVIEEFSISGMGHGTPLDTAGAESCGRGGAYMLDVNISSTHHIARFWGLIGPSAPATERLPSAAVLSTEPQTSDRAVPTPVRHPIRMPAPSPELPPLHAAGVGKVIEDALRAAGLMR